MLIHHVAIWVRDIELVKGFYLKYFDCKCNNKYVNEEKGFSSYFISFLSGGRIELMMRKGVGEAIGSEVFGYTHLAIDVGSRSAVDVLTDRLKRDGFSVVGWPRVTGDGYYESVVLDPENNRLELVAQP